MSTAELRIDPGMQEVSDFATLVDDDALVDFTGTPAEGDPVMVGRCGMFTLFVEAYPETGHEIHLTLQSTFRAGLDAWFSQSDGASNNVAPLVWKFTAQRLVELGPFYGAARAIRAIYGFSGGDGTGAALKVYVLGRAQ